MPVAPPDLSPLVGLGQREVKEAGAVGISLVADETFTGEVVDLTDWAYLDARVHAEPAGAVGTLYFEMASTPIQPDPWPTSIARVFSDSAAPVPSPVLATSQFGRIRFVNGDTPLTSLTIQVFAGNEPRLLTGSMDQVLSQEFPVQMVRVINDVQADIAASLRDGVNSQIWIAKGSVSVTPAIVGPVGWVGTDAMLLAPDSFTAVSTSANDAAGGSGAPRVVLQYIDETTGKLTAFPISLTGTTPTASTPVSGWRLTRAGTAQSGTYVNLFGSNDGDITIQATGGAIVGLIAAGVGESEQGLFTIPGNAIGVIDRILIIPEGNKTIDVRLMRHDSITTVVAPFGSVREVFSASKLGGPLPLDEVNIGTIGSYSDLYWVAATTSGTADVTILTTVLLYESIT